MISDWSTRFNMRVVRCEDRPDRPAGDTVYRLVDLFTTNGGSWDPSDRLGSVTSWARAKYLRPLGASDFFDDAGGDHHLFARVLDANGQPIITEELICFWSDGFDRLADTGYAGFFHATPKRHSGWANQPIFDSFNPERGERGAWCWCPEGAADVVCGGGLPNNHHVSFFAVWQAQPREDTGPRERPTDRTTGPTPDTRREQPPVLDAEAIRKHLWHARGVSLDGTAPFAAHARAHKLGAPLTGEIDVGGFRVQGFANGIVYAPLDRLDAAGHIEW